MRHALRRRVLTAAVLAIAIAIAGESLHLGPDATILLFVLGIAAIAAIVALDIVRDGIEDDSS